MARIVLFGILLGLAGMECKVMAEDNKPMGRPGIILLHGAGLGSHIWEKVIPMLNLPSLAIDLPGRGGEPASTSAMRIQDLAAFAVQKINKSAFDRVILAAHSVSGGLALKIASLMPGKVISIVFIASGIPESGHSYIDSLPFISRTMIRVLSWLKPNGMKAPESVIRTALCNDLDQADADKIVAKMVPEHPSLFIDEVEWSQPARSVYVLLSQDKSDVSPQLQGELASRLQNKRLVTIQSGHLAMLSHPSEIAEILNFEANSVR